MNSNSYLNCCNHVR